MPSLRGTTQCKMGLWMMSVSLCFLHHVSHGCTRLASKHKAMRAVPEPGLCPPPPACETDGLVRTTRGHFSATFGLGGRTYLGLKGRPYFAARDEMVRMLEGLAAHCVTQWQRRLSRPLHAVPMADFLGGFFPPAPAGKAPLRRTSGHNDGCAAR